jgi:predicted  nucleic acid-binding Zn-ribbon protein
MKKTSQAIATELATLESRRESLSTDTEAARVKLDAAREQLVRSATGAKQVTAAQAEYSALNEALKSLDERIETKRTELDAALADEEKRAVAARDAELKATCERLQSEHDADAVELDAVINAFTARVLARSREFNQAMRERFSFLPAHQRANTIVERSWSKSLQYPTLQFGEAIHAAINRAAREADRHRARGTRAA